MILDKDHCRSWNYVTNYWQRIWWMICYSLNIPKRYGIWLYTLAVHWMSCKLCYGTHRGRFNIAPCKRFMKNYFPIFLHVCNPKVDIIFYILISFYTFTPVYNLLFVSWWRVIFIYNGEVETYLDNTVVVLEQCLLSQSVLYMFILYGAKFKVWWSFYP